jgi:hypothetical protein
LQFNALLTLILKMENVSLALEANIILLEMEGLLA